MAALALIRASLSDDDATFGFVLNEIADEDTLAVAVAAVFVAAAEIEDQLHGDWEQYVDDLAAAVLAMGDTQ